MSPVDDHDPAPTVGGVKGVLTQAHKRTFDHDCVHIELRSPAATQFLAQMHEEITMGELTPAGLRAWADRIEAFAPQEARSNVCVSMYAGLLEAPIQMALRFDLSRDAVEAADRAAQEDWIEIADAAAIARLEKQAAAFGMKLIEIGN